MKATWPKSRTTPVPTDQYYAELTEDWNANGNHRVGEFSDDIDLTPEVYVGRIPFDRVSRVDRVLRKTIAYDIATEQGGPAIAWRRNVLLPMSRMDSDTDGAFLGVHMVNHYLIENGFRPLTLFQDHEQPRLGFHADMELTSGCVPELWSRNAFGMVWWEAHGSSTGASIWRSGTLINNHLIEQVHPLPEDRPAIVFSASCNNARAERYSLASSLIRTGAIAVIAATRPSHYLRGQRFGFRRTGAASPTIAYNVGKLLVKHRMAVGKALYEYKGRIHPNKSLWFKNTLVYNLYGDPSIRLHKEPLFGENPTTSPTADAPRPDTVNGRGKSKPITPRIEWFRN
jgi:hypothetical protein